MTPLTVILEVWILTTVRHQPRSDGGGRRGEAGGDHSLTDRTLLTAVSPLSLPSLVDPLHCLEEQYRSGRADSTSSL